MSCSILEELILGMSSAHRSAKQIGRMTVKQTLELLYDPWGMESILDVIFYLLQNPLNVHGREGDMFSAAQLIK